MCNCWMDLGYGRHHIECPAVVGDTVMAGGDLYTIVDITTGGVWLWSGAGPTRRWDSHDVALCYRPKHRHEWGPKRDSDRPQAFCRGRHCWGRDRQSHRLNR